jgi:hypothetical protein
MDKIPIPPEELQGLKDFSQNEFAKNRLRDSKYYREMYELYRSKNEVEMKRLGDNYKL